MSSEVKLLVFSIVVMFGISVILGLVLGVFAKLFHVEEDRRIEEVAARLPGINCGACGFPGCSGLATAIVNDGASPRLCKPGTMTNFEAIKVYLEETPGPDGNIIKVRL
jgi:electron transport complex protein RnfB